MEKGNIFIFSLLLIGLSVIGLMTVNSSQDNQNKVNFDLHNSSGVKRTDSGTKYLIHPNKLIAGCPGKDCIPSIDDPKFISADQTDYLNPDDRVIGLEIDGESRAYPLRILRAHEIVNDRVGGEPVAVTYCPLCRSGLTYSRKVGNQTLEFGVSGKLYKANLIMYDRKTETYWSQIKGKAVIGPLVPKELELIYSSVTNWSEWRKGHPNTEVLSRDTEIYPPSTYSGSQYAGYRQSENVGFGVNNVDNHLPAKELVYGIKIGGKSKAYTEKALKQEDLIRDSIRNKSVIIFKSPLDGTVKAYLVEEDLSKTEFKLSDEGLKNSDVNIDDLKSLNPRGFYWFAWSKFNPDTEVYKSESVK